MKKRNGIFFSRAGLFAVFLSLPAMGLAGTPNKPIQGDLVKAWGGDVWSEATLDKDGRVDSLSLFISMDSIKGVPMMDMESALIPLPEVAREQTFFDHISLDWNPHGHEPVGVYTKPHFDIHFYHPTVKEVAAVDCSVQSLIPADIVADGFALPDLTAAGSCVPGMGIHAAPVSDFAPDYNFEETFIYGYYGSELTFFEPMITKEFFLEKKEVERELANPVTFNLIPQSLPHSYSVTYDEASDLYRLTFRDFGAAEKPEEITN